MLLYVLEKDKTTRKVDQAEFDAWLRNNGDMDARTVGYENVNGVVISTVFLCVNQSKKTEAPILFETAVLKNGFVDLFQSYSSWSEATKGHQRAVNKEMERLKL